MAARVACARRSCARSWKRGARQSIRQQPQRSSRCCMALRAALVTSSLHKVLAEGVIRYSQVWEDHALVEEGLDVQPGDDVLSIGSAGCNVLAVLLREPRRVLAIDLNPSQTSLIELKLRAIESLEWEELVQLVGVAPSADRLALYEKVRPRLGDAARTYWDAREDALTNGVHWSGRLEQFFHKFHAEILPTVHDA